MSNDQTPDFRLRSQKHTTHSTHHGAELGRAYVPMQRMGEVLEPWKALRKGTVFPELYRPYKK